MAEMKEFDTLIIGSLTCGCTLRGGPFGDLHEAAEWVMGHSIWTHEFADKALWLRMSDAIRAHLPDMPAPYEDGEKPDWKAVGAALIDRYGETVSLPRGQQERTEGPMESLQRLAPGKPVIGVVVPE